MPAPELPPHVCPACGTVNEAALAALEEKTRVNDAISVELGHLRSQLGRMRADENERKKQSRHMPQANEVFALWRSELHPGAREFSGKRLANTLARLEAGAEVEELKEAVLGAGVEPYVRGGKVFDDLEVIMRSEKSVMHFRQVWRLERERVAAHALAMAEAGGREAAMAGYAAALTDAVAARLEQLRGWSPVSVRNLGLGLDGRRVVFPSRAADGTLVGFARYAPDPRNRRLKMVAEGPRELFPRPEAYAGGTAWLVEGEGDAVSGRTCGLQAVGVPGVQAWKAEWPERFSRFDEVAVCFDCDEVGREAAHARAGSLAGLVTARVVDLDPGRDDGWDVTDALRELGRAGASALLRERVAAAEHVAAPISRPPGQIRVNPRAERGPGIAGFVRALEAAGCRPRLSGGQWTARCPAHEDRHASLRAREGDDGRVLVTCFAGCATGAVVSALGLRWSDLFCDGERRSV